MKITETYLVLALAGLSASPGGAVETGWTRAEVVAELGRPDGLISSGGYELLSYERGDVELRDGVVVEFELMTDEELVEFKRAERIRREAERLQAAERRQERYRRGLEVKQQMLNSPVYAEASGTRRVEMLRRFHSRFPEVEIEELLLPAVEDKRREQAEAAEERRLAELEERVEQAEWRAQQAEWRASEAKLNAENAMRWGYWNQGRYYGYGGNYRPRGFGLSVGYESPELNIRYTSEFPYGARRTFHVPPRKSGTIVHEVAPKRIRSTSSTVRFNDGL